MTVGGLLMLFVTQAVPAQAIPVDSGVVSAVMGEARLVRPTQELVLTPGMIVRSGDRVQTGPDGGAIIFWREGVLVYMGKSTSVGLASGPQRSLALDRGEIRIVAGSSGGVQLTAPLVETRMGRGIIQVQAGPQRERYLARSGSARLRSREELVSRPGRRYSRNADGSINLVAWQDEEDGLTLQAGQQVTYIAGDGFGEVEALDEADWGLDVDALKAAASNQAGQTRSNLAQQVPTQDQPPTTTTTTDDTGDTTDWGLGGGNSVNLTSGSVLASRAPGAGGLFSDAGQDSLSGMLTAAHSGVPAGNPFPGNIHLITGQSSYTLESITLTPADGFPMMREFWSIGRGASPDGQIVTGIGTGTGPRPVTERIPKFDAYLVHLSEFDLVDPASPDAAGNQRFSVPGLTTNSPMDDPFNPNIIGGGSEPVDPLLDNRSQFNDRATFALGELSVEVADQNTAAPKPSFSVRRSDQDRRIIKVNNGSNNDDMDIITANPDVKRFEDVDDPLFFPNVPNGVKVPVRGPDALRNTPRYRNLNLTRRAGLTTLMARKLSGVARRTGQTRFVIDGQIVDITGYKGPNP